MRDNLTPWAEQDIEQQEVWLEARLERQFCRDIAVAARNLLSDRACGDCGYVWCSCPEPEPETEKMCPRCQHFFGADGDCHNGLCGVPGNPFSVGDRVEVSVLNDRLQGRGTVTEINGTVCIVDVDERGCRSYGASRLRRVGPETDWADDVHPCGPWEIDPSDNLPLRRRLDDGDEGAYILRLRRTTETKFRWQVVLAVPTHDGVETYGGVVDTIEEAKAAADARLMKASEEA